MDVRRSSLGLVICGIKVSGMRFHSGLRVHFLNQLLELLEVGIFLIRREGPDSFT